VPPDVNHSTVLLIEFQTKTGILYTVEPALLHNTLHYTFVAVRQVYAAQPEMGKTADFEVDALESMTPHPPPPTPLESKSLLTVLLSFEVELLPCIE